MRTTYQKTSNYEMMRPLRQDQNLLEVPDLGKVPEKYHSLFYHLRKQPYVASFQMAKTKKKIMLHVQLREGETASPMVRARITSLFAGVKATVFPAGPKDDFINITIPA